MSVHFRPVNTTTGGTAGPPPPPRSIRSLLGLKLDPVHEVAKEMWLLCDFVQLCAVLYGSMELSAVLCGPSFLLFSEALCSSVQLCAAL